MKKAIIIFTVLTGIILLYSVYEDPLSFPFPDWDQMSEETKQSYTEKSKKLSEIKKVITPIFCISFITLIISIIPKKENEKDLTNGSN